MPSLCLPSTPPLSHLHKFTSLDNFQLTRGATWSSHKARASTDSYVAQGAVKEPYPCQCTANTGAAGGVFGGRGQGYAKAKDEFEQKVHDA